MTSVALDTSYKRTGLAVAINNQVVTVHSVKFKTKDTKTEKRQKVAKRLEYLIKRYSPDIIITERTRQFSAGFMSMPAIAAQVTMTAVVVDVAFKYGIPVYSVDTRSWKAQILGTSKPKGGDKKRPALEFVETLGFELNNNDDAADAACMSLYPFIPKEKQKLKLEK